MKTMLLVISLICVIAFAAAADSPEVITCLKGLDPIELAQGKEIQGVASLSVIRGKYRYLFASAGNKTIFEKAPELYAIQMGGACGRMGPLNGLGDPHRFYVHEKKIYIFASESCRNNFKAAPENHIDQADAAPEGSAADIKRAQELIELALKGFGGAAKVDAVANFQTSINKPYKLEDGTMADFITKNTVAFPAQYRIDQTWNNGSWAAATNSQEGFFDGEETWAMENAAHEYMIREFSRRPLVILKARNEAGFRAVAAGRGKAGEAEVEFVKVGINGATSTLGIDPQTGRILSVAYRGRAMAAIGDVVKTFSDFREADGLMPPFKTEVTVNGEAIANLASTLDAIAVNSEIDGALFTMPD